MANWQLPTTASTYVNYTIELDARLDDLAYGLDPALTTVTNAPTGTQRWTSATSKWEKYNGTSWVDLAATYGINVATANAWSTGRTVSLTGDVTATSAAWTGSANLSLAATLTNVNSNVGSFGSATAVPVITVNAKGLITAVATSALGTIASQSAGSVAITGGTITGTAITLVQSTTAAPTGEGVMEWDTDDDVLKIGTGTSTKTLVNTDSAQTLTNKTLSAGSTWSGNAIALASGGTGATDAATARTNLGIASMGTQASTGVSITGGAISGTAITLVQSTTAAPTAEGRLEWDTDDDLLVLGTSTGSKIQVNTDSTQTLTNKTLGAGSSWTGNVIAASYIATLNQSTTGNAATATKLATARAINGISFDGTAAITITANTPTALTFNNAGAGVVSGTTFDGSAARTISYNTVGAPSTAGANASGTWSISVTGNAGTVTNGVYVTGDQSIAGVKTITGQVNTAINAKITLATGLNMFHDSANAYFDMITGSMIIRESTGSQRFSFASNGQLTTYGNISCGGSVTASGAVTGYSDERLKTNWRPTAVDLVEKLADVKSGIYDRVDLDETQLGVGAQSLAKILPEAVYANADGILSVAYGNAAMVACVALAKEIIAIRAELSSLKGNEK